MDDLKDFETKTDAIIRQLLEEVPPLEPLADNISEYWKGIDPAQPVEIPKQAMIAILGSIRKVATMSLNASSVAASFSAGRVDDAVEGFKKVAKQGLEIDRGVGLTLQTIILNSYLKDHPDE